ncbi:MAG: DUF3667 domain-containing protein, partial [Bacteroidota bacterium]
CRNCQQEVHGHYCSNCGQPSNTPDIGPKFVFRHLRKAFISFNSGYFYTVKTLMLRPGEMLRGYIEGKRIKQMNPFSFVLLTAGAYVFLFKYYNINPLPNNTDAIDFSIFTTWYSSHFALFQLCLIPLYSFGTWIAFGRKKFNFSEYIILNTFMGGQRLFMSLVLFPLLYIFNGTPFFTIAVNINTASGLLLFFWSCNQLFNEHSRIKTFFQTLLAYTIIFGISALTFLAIFSNSALASFLFR